MVFNINPPFPELLQRCLGALHFERIGGGGGTLFPFVSDTTNEGILFFISNTVLGVVIHNTGWAIVKVYTFKKLVTFYSEEIFYLKFLHWNNRGINGVCGKFYMQCYFYQDQILSLEKKVLFFSFQKFTHKMHFFPNKIL